MKNFLCLFLLIAFARPFVFSQDRCCAAKTTDTEWYRSGKKAPLFDGLDKLAFSISCMDKQVQQYFRQGLMLAYAFNHAEAARSFFEASRLDTGCAMSQWGYAYVLGPNYNGGMEKDNYERAYDAVQRALQLSARATPREKDLIAAMVKRYSPKHVEDRKPLDSAYASAMREVYKKYPGDVDIAALFAESIMDLHPWDLYTKRGEPKSWTPEILSVLEHAMKLDPRHPGANHFYIHAVEASATPEKGLASADLLRDLVPNAGHLVHMPAHIYIHTGQYHDGTLANQRAIAADGNYFTSCHAQGVYPLVYFPHNYHFLAATATMEGNSKLAMEAAEKVEEYSNKELMSKPEWATLQHYAAIPYFVAVKFGKWDYILERRKESLPYLAAIRHYARGMAFLAKGNQGDAKGELVQLIPLEKDTSLQSLTIWGINSLSSIVSIARHVLEGELMASSNGTEGGIALLREAVHLEDQLNYDEPPDWFFSVRHHLAAVLTEQKQYGDAVSVLIDDLSRHKGNGWALAGIHQALTLSGNKEKTEMYEKEFQKAWKYADVKITGSRILK